MPKLKTLRNILFILVILLLFFLYFSRGHIYQPDELEYGLTFSKKQASDLGFDWQQVYLAILDELGAKKIRLPAYWDEVENSQGQYSWQDLDWQVEQAGQRGVKIILAVGGRLPRWPECHFPDWTKNLTKPQRETAILDYLKETVNRYKNNQQITAWQIENEPFLSHFGDCPTLNKQFLDQEIILARQLDERPLIITDSGELSLWWLAAGRGDIFGTTLYRDTYSNLFRNYIHYPITPAFFRFKKNLVSLFVQPKDWIVIELQAEPWCPGPYQNYSQTERDRTMNLEKFKDIIEFSRQTGFKQFYLWGVEWWYWEKALGRPEAWEYAKTLFNK